MVSFVQSRGRAASPLAAGNRDAQVDVMGGADARRPESVEKSVRTFPSTPFDMTDSGGQGLPALPTLERFCPFPEVSHPHGRAEARPSRSLSTGRDALLRVRERNGGATMEPSGEEPVVSFVQSLGRAASPLAAGNRDVQVAVMGGAAARRPESGEKSVRTFPATPFGMTDSGGQGLPALPTGSLPSPRSGFHAFQCLLSPFPVPPMNLQPTRSHP